MQPYPGHLVQAVVLADGTRVTLRPIRPEDAEIEQQFVRGLSDESRYFRFMDGTRELSAKALAHFTAVDYDRHLALIAVVDADGREVEIGVARYVVEAGEDDCEFAVVVADEWQHRGVGTHLMRALADAARARGLRRMHGEVLAGNAKMLRFARRHGFRTVPHAGGAGVIRIERQL